MNDNKKTIAVAFVNEVFKRSIEILKNMEGDEILAVSKVVFFCSHA